MWFCFFLVLLMPVYFLSKSSTFISFLTASVSRLPYEIPIMSLWNYVHPTLYIYFFYFSDAVYVDKNGKIYITGRLKDIINRGGEKISPAEVEELLQSYPNIVEVYVSCLFNIILLKKYFKTSPGYKNAC